MIAPARTAEDWLRTHDPEYNAKDEPSSDGWKALRRKHEKGHLEFFDTPAELYERAVDPTAGKPWIGLGLCSPCPEGEYHNDDHRRYVPRDDRQSGYCGPWSEARSDDLIDRLMRENGRLDNYGRGEVNVPGGRDNEHALNTPRRRDLSTNEAVDELLGDGDRGHVVVGYRSSEGYSIKFLRAELEAEVPAPWSLEDLTASLRPGRPSAERRARRDALVRVVATLDRRATSAREKWHSNKSWTTPDLTQALGYSAKRLRADARKLPAALLLQEEGVMATTVIDLEAGRAERHRQLLERIDRLEGRLAETLNAIQWDVRQLVARFPDNERVLDAAAVFGPDSDYSRYWQAAA